MSHHYAHVMAAAACLFPNHIAYLSLCLRTLYFAAQNVGPLG